MNSSLRRGTPKGCKGSDVGGGGRVVPGAVCIHIHNALPTRMGPVQATKIYVAKGILGNRHTLRESDRLFGTLPTRYGTRSFAPVVRTARSMEYHSPPFISRILFSSGVDPSLPFPRRLPDPFAFHRHRIVNGTSSREPCPCSHTFVFTHSPLRSYLIQ